MTLPKTIAFAARLRAKYPQTGLILFSYMNPLLHIGYDAVCQQLADAGVDGILPVDLPLEERGELLAPARAHGLHVIPLVSPLTPEDRVAKIVEGMTGFVYYINVAGVTGARDGSRRTDCDDQTTHVSACRRRLRHRLRRGRQSRRECR